MSASELKKVERVKKTAIAESLPQLLVKLGLCSELDVADAFVESGQFEKVAPDQYPLETQLPDNVSLRFLRQYHVVGMASNDDSITVTMMDAEELLLDALRLATERILFQSRFIIRN